MRNKYTSLLLLVICLTTATTAFTQQDAASKNDRKDKREANGIGGKEHNAEILGVKIGMDFKKIRGFGGATKKRRNVSAFGFNFFRLTK